MMKRWFAILAIAAIVFTLVGCGGGYKGKCEEWLKERLKDPDSLKIIEWGDLEEKKDGTYTIRIKYSATNSFGARISATQLFILNEEKEIMRAYKL
jgi:hypothetical protein